MSDLLVVSFRPEPEQYAWTFGGAAPAMRIRTPAVLEVYTEDCFGGRVRSEQDLVSEVCEFPFLNPQTGPFYIEGAEPGDTVAVHFVSIEPARSWAASTTVPLFGALTGTHLTALLQDPLPEVVWLWQLDAAARTCRFSARRSSFEVDLPMEPMHGTVGVAPANLEVRSALVPDAFGGNMDTPEMRAGVTCYLGVNVEGALLSLGDGHARQGEGETCGVAVECAMNTVLVVDLIKGVPCPWPRLESDTHIMSAGSARPLEDAFRIAQHDMVSWVAELCGLDRLDAYQLVTQAVESPLANVCDTNYTSIAKMAKRYLSPGGAMDGRARPAARPGRRLPGLKTRLITEARRAQRSLSSVATWAASYRSPATASAGTAASIAARSSALSVRSSALSASASRSRRLVPISGMMSSPREATQAIASWAAVTPWALAIASSAASSSRFRRWFSPVNRGKRVRGSPRASRAVPLLSRPRDKMP